MTARRILCLGPPGYPAIRLLRDLTGSEPVAPQQGSVAGLSHEWEAKTAYYTATVPIWLDEINDSTEWSSEFMKPEAKQVVEALGAWVYCFVDDGSAECVERFDRDLTHIHKVVTEHDAGSAAVMLAVRCTAEDKSNALDEGRYTLLEDVVIQHNFELIDYAAIGTNDYGERQGIERVREALETNDWTTDDNAGVLDDYGAFEDEFNFNEEDNDHESAFSAAFRESLLSSAELDLAENSAHDQTDVVDDLEFMLGKLLAAKEQAMDLPLELRKRLAAKAVKDIMAQNG